MNCEARHGHLLHLTQLRESIQRSLEHNINRLVSDGDLDEWKRGHIEAAVVAASNELETLAKRIAKLTNQLP